MSPLDDVQAELVLAVFLCALVVLVWLVDVLRTCITQTSAAIASICDEHDSEEPQS